MRSDSVSLEAILNPTPDSDVCRHTVQGKFLVADDRGYVCERFDLGKLDLTEDRESGCCSESDFVDRYSCRTCNETSQVHTASNAKCCSSFEYCVSCCLSPSPDQRDRLSSVLSTQRPVFQLTNNLFDFCTATCRTSGNSVLQNKYRNPDLRHCYGSTVPDTSDSAELTINYSKTTEELVRLPGDTATVAEWSLELASPELERAGGSSLVSLAPIFVYLALL